MATPQQSSESGKGHRRLMLKILISLLGFLAAFGLSQLVPTDQSPAFLWNIGASLFVAGVVFIAQYLFDVERRLDSLEAMFERHADATGQRLAEHAGRTEEQLNEGFSKINLATELFDLRDSAQLKPDELAQMTKLVRSSTRIASSAKALVQDFAQIEITRLAEYLKQLGDGGDLSYEGEDRDWLLALTRVARSSIRATSLSTVDAGGRSFIDGGLWRSDLGLRYLDLQRQAIEQRKIKIQRIFIIDRKELSNDLDEVLRLHLNAGVEVRTLNAAATPGIHTRLRDFIVFDEVLSYQSTPESLIGERDPIIVTTTLVTHPARVRERCDAFDRLWNDGDAVVVALEDGQLTYGRARE